MLEAALVIGGFIVGGFFGVLITGLAVAASKNGSSSERR
jgi:hypothetical protein